jgi:RNA polymerase sigma-70 factor, ECF subfamily
MSETEQIKKLKSGDETSFREIVLQNQSIVLNTCFRFVNNREDAEDIAQEVFVEVYHSLSSFRGDAKLSTWIYRIAVTKSLDFVRKKKRKKRFGQIKQIFGVKEEVENVPANGNSNPQQKIETEERAQVLKITVDSLAENQKIAITLSKYEGLSYKEISEVMGTTVSAVESLIHRGMKNLKKKLSTYYEKSLD